MKITFEEYRKYLSKEKLTIKIYENLKTDLSYSLNHSMYYGSNCMIKIDIKGIRISIGEIEDDYYILSIRNNIFDYEYYKLDQYDNLILKITDLINHLNK